MSTPEAGAYLRWKKDVEQHDYAAASSYLSIRFGESQAGGVSGLSPAAHGQQSV
jgi:hypothetical protein